MKQFRSPTKLLVAGVALTAALGLSACSSDDASADESTSSSSSSSAQFARPEPVASLPAIPAGGSTAVALDAGFVEALTTLGLTPGTVGGATLADGSISFPITGGTVTVFDKETGYKPYVQGTLFHRQHPEPADHRGRRGHPPGHRGAAQRRGRRAAELHVQDRRPGRRLPDRHRDDHGPDQLIG
jgi:hypothetical protein